MPYARLLDTRSYNLDQRIWHDYHQAHIAWRKGDVDTAFRIYRDIRAQNGIELFYEVVLASPTKFVHPIGTVLGRADYAPHLVVYQGVSVGSTVDGERPKFTGPCVLFPHAGVIGPVTVGSNVWIKAGTIVEASPGKPRTIPDNTVVYNQGQGWGERGTKRSVVNTFFG